MKMTDASLMTDVALVAARGRLAGSEREATVALIVHLVEFESRRLYEAAGFRTGFQFCMEVLQLTEDAAFNRVETARVARRYPGVVDMLLEGSLSPTTTRMLARWLTPENHRELFAAAAFKSKRQVEGLIAHRFPQPDVAPSVRKLPAPRPVAPAPPDRPAPPPCAPPVTVTAPDRAMASPPPALALADRSRLHVVRPLSPDRYEFRFTGRAATREKLRRAQDLLSHAIPSGDIGEVFDRTLTLLVEDLTRKKYAAVTRPRAARRNARSSGGIIPAAVRRAVFERDAGRCAFVSTSGRQCGDRRFLELHHVIPRAAGGEATVDNIQLRCRAHNGHEVDLFFGPGKRYRKDVTVGPAAPPFPFRNGTPGTLPARTDTPAGAGTGG